MGLAQAGTVIRSGDPLKVQGLAPSGIAVAGKTIYSVPTGPQLLNVGYATNPQLSLTMDTTGATLLIGVGMSGNANWSITDAPLNTWTSGALGIYLIRSQIFYCINPATDPNHTFNFTDLGYSTFLILAFKTPPLAYDQNTTSSGFATIPFQMTALTPSAANSLIVCANTINRGPANTFTIDSGFTIAQQISAAGNYTGAVAFLAQSDAVTVAPSWTLQSGDYMAGTMVCFRPT